MSKLSNYAENAAINHLLGRSAWTMPTANYLQLHTADPGENCTTAVASTNTRQALTYSAAASLAIENNNAVSFTATAAETITHFSVWDASTAGNPIYYGQFGASQTLGIGDLFNVAAGAVDLSFASTALTTYSANKLLDHLTGRAAWTMPTANYWKLHTGAPGVDATANAATTSTRVVGAFGAPSDGVCTNSSAIQWTGAANETVTAVSAWDASTAGNALLQGNLTASKAITSGGLAEFAAGQLSVALQ